MQGSVLLHLYERLHQAQRNEEAYRIWKNQNKNRKLTLIKPSKLEAWTAPEYGGKGKNHAQWEEAVKARERTKGN